MAIEIYVEDKGQEKLSVVNLLRQNPRNIVLVSAKPSLECNVVKICGTVPEPPEVPKVPEDGFEGYLKDTKSYKISMKQKRARQYGE